MELNKVELESMDKGLKIAVAIKRGATRDTFIPPDLAGKINAMGAVSWNELERDYDPSELAEAIREADICITGWGCRRFEEHVLKGAERLKIIAHTGGSVAAIVSDFLYDRGVKVISGNELYAESVAEGVIGYVLASLRDLPCYINRVKSGGWAEEGSYNQALLGQEVGLVGFGAVARHLSRMLKVFRNRVRVYDPFVSDEAFAEYGVERADSLDEIFLHSKIISLHMPKTPETYHMIDQRLLSCIPDGALLVNTARGSVIDEEALADELRKGRFKAVLDVYETEPLPADSKLRGLDNAILMPHMAGPTVDLRKCVTQALLADIEGYLLGRPLRHEIQRGYAMKMTTA